MPYVILGLHLSSEDYFENDADWLRVPVSDVTLHATLARAYQAKLAKELDGGFVSLTYWDYSVDPFGCGSWRYQPGELIEKPIISKIGQSDYSHIVIMPDKVRWEGGIKHTPVHWTSDEISVEQLRRWQAQLARSQS